MNQLTKIARDRVDAKTIVRCLGLRKVGQVVALKDNPAVRGQIMTVQHLLDVTVEK